MSAKFMKNIFKSNYTNLKKRNMKKFIVKNFYYLGAIGLFFVIFIVNSSQAYAVGETCSIPIGAANANCCTAPPIIELTGGCADGQYWIGSASGGKCVDNPSSTCTEKFSCLTGGCVNRDTNRWARVLYDSLPGGEDVFKIWYGDVKGRLISLADTDCNDGEVPIWDNNTKVWACGANGGGGSSVWTKKADSTVYYNDGNVGIGTNVPTDKLDITGAINTNKGATTGAVALKVNGKEALWSDGSTFSWGYGGNMNVFADKVIIGSTGAPNASLTVVGSATIGSGATANVNQSFSAGLSTDAFGDRSVAFNNDTTASGAESMAIGNKTHAIGRASVAMGRETTASGDASTAMGVETEASANISTAMGYQTIASGFYSTAMGEDTDATNTAATAMGYQAYAGGYASVAIGKNARATGYASTAMGWDTSSVSNASFASGMGSYATGDASTAMGFYSSTFSNASVAIGYRNKATYDGATALGSNMDFSGAYGVGIGLGSGVKTVYSPGNLVIMGGNVGIGTASPSQALDVGGNITASGNIIANNNVYGTSGEKTWGTPGGGSVACPDGMYMIGVKVDYVTHQTTPYCAEL